MIIRRGIMNRWSICLLILLLPLLCHVQAGAVEPQQRDAPLEITSKQLEADETAGTVVFIGEVVAVQADVTIYAGRLTVYYRRDDRQVERVVAEEDVRIIQGDKVATGQRAVYLRSKAEIVLTGDPRVNQGQDFVTGDKITVLLNENRSIVDSNNEGRVNAVFHPRSQKQ